MFISGASRPREIPQRYFSQGLRPSDVHAHVSRPPCSRIPEMATQARRRRPGFPGRGSSGAVSGAEPARDAGPVTAAHSGAALF